MTIMAVMRTRAISTMMEVAITTTAETTMREDGGEGIDCPGMFEGFRPLRRAIRFSPH